MSSLADLPEIVGFFSYSREDDEAFEGTLSALRDAIQRELSAQLGRSKTTFRLWQDQAAIAPGQLWESEIKTAVEQAVFFIPIVTPRAVNSHHCKFEFEAFLARERALERTDLVFPLLYIGVQALEDEARWRKDPVLSIIGSRQYIDWRPLRHDDVRTTAVRVAIERFCAKIVEALRKPWVSPEERRAEAARQAEEEKQRAEAARQAEEEKQRAEAARQAEEEKQRAEAARQAEEEKQRAEAPRQAEEEKQRAEAAPRFWNGSRWITAEEEQRRAEAAPRFWDGSRWITAEEEQRRAEAARLAEVQKQRAEAARYTDEERQQAETARQAEAERSRAEPRRPRIAIIYRRDDSAVICGRIFDRLVAHYGANSVFRDVDNIPLGVDFRDHINSVLAQTDITLVVVGKRWVGPPRRGRRIDDPADPVRVEVETALRNGMPVVPVLVEGGAMPTVDQLPDSLSEFVYRNGLAVDSGRDFDQHIKRLIRNLEPVLVQRAEAARHAEEERQRAEGSAAGGERAGRSVDIDAQIEKLTRGEEELQNKLTLGHFTNPVEHINVLRYIDSLRAKIDALGITKTTDHQMEPNC